MKKKNKRLYLWEIVASVDGIDIDYTTEIYSKTEPDYWRVHNIAEKRGCDFYYLQKRNGWTW